MDLPAIAPATATQAIPAGGRGNPAHPRDARHTRDPTHTMINALIARIISPAVAALLWSLAKAHLVALFEEAEKAFADPGSGAFKKEAVITAINDRVDVPGLTEPQEQVALRVILGPAIDRAVAWWQAEKAAQHAQ